VSPSTVKIERREKGGRIRVQKSERQGEKEKGKNGGWLGKRKNAVDLEGGRGWVEEGGK